jgi:hypothetical protein
MKITLTNSFHRRQITLKLRNPFLSDYQLRKAKGYLCGNKQCQCSGVAGMHGEQPIGTTVLSQEIDPRNNRLVPRFLIK